MQETDFSILTIGHSTRSLDELCDLLAVYAVKHLVDVRTVPRSRRNPQFNRETLPGDLRRRGINYTHLEALGGLRKTRPDSINTGWRNASFRGYADYMQTNGFAAGIDELLAIARGARAAIMCAEAVPWRCHRSLIADALTVRGESVGHILSGQRLMPHTPTKFAVVNGERIRYPGTGSASGDLFADDG